TPQYPDCFRDLLRGANINAANNDLAGTGHSALNFTGSAGTSSATWLTIVDQAPENPDEDNLVGSQTLCADILIRQFDNSKGAGIVALFNEGPGAKGLALLLINNGNSDRLVLASVDGNPAAAGALSKLATVKLGALLEENKWYRIILTVLVDSPTPQIMGEVFAHATPTDPNSALVTPPNIAPLTYMALPDGVERIGENGVIAMATKATVDSSVTNFTNMIATCHGTGDDT